MAAYTRSAKKTYAIYFLQGTFMIKTIAIAVSAGLLGVIVLLAIILSPDRSRTSYVPTKLNLASSHNEAPSPLLPERSVAAVDSRFTDAPASIIDIARKIADPNIPLSAYRDDLLSLSREEINKGYGHPFPDKFPEYTHTLLREAVIDGKTGVVALLVQAGADMSYNDNEMPFQAVTMDPAPGTLDFAFPDYTAGAKILSLWLRQAGNVDISNPLHDPGTLLQDTPVRNLTAVLMLLETGADPWSPYPIRTDDGHLLYNKPSFFSKLVKKDVLYNEVAFRAAIMGYYADPPRDAAAALAEQYTTLLRNLPADQTNREKAQEWTIRKAAETIALKINDQDFQRTLRQILESRGQLRTGGFFLGPNDLHSPYHSNQRLSVGNRWGSQQWK